MKSLLVCLLIAAVPLEIFGIRGDIGEDELPTPSLGIPLIGKLLQILKEQDDFSKTLDAQATTEEERLKEVMKKSANEAINNIKDMNICEECTELGIKLVEIENLNSQFKIRECLMTTVVSMAPSIAVDIPAIYDRVRMYGANVMDAEIKNAIHSWNNRSDFVEMTFNCIHEILDDFNSTMSNSTGIVERCSDDNDSLIVSSMALCSELAETYDLFVDIFNFYSKFETILQADLLLSTNEGTEMDKEMNEAISVIETTSKNMECSQLGIDQLYINRLGSWLGDKECLVMRLSSDMALLFVDRRGINEIMSQFSNYANDLKNGVGIGVQNYEMVLNTHMLRMIVNRLMEGAGKLTINNDCYRRNHNNFKLSIDGIYAGIYRCQNKHGFSSLI